MKLGGKTPNLPPEHREEFSRVFNPHTAKLFVELEGIVPALPLEQSEKPSRGFNP